MKQGMFVAVELVDRGDGVMVPDLADAGDLKGLVTREGGKRFSIVKGKQFLDLLKLGTFNSNLVFYAVASSQQVFDALEARLGSVKVGSIKQALNKPAFASWLQTTVGLKPIRRVSDGQIVGILPPNVLAGQDPVAIGLDGEFVEGEEYEF